jgi:hypothetical protein
MPLLDFEGPHGLPRRQRILPDWTDMDSVRRWVFMPIPRDQVHELAAMAAREVRSPADFYCTDMVAEILARMRSADW